MSQKPEAPSETSQSESSPSETSPSETSTSDTLSSAFANIEYPGQHDVKLGRGGDANSHIGNIKFRQLINQYKPRYIAASRSNKPFVAEEVVQIWRNLDPPGRFLIRSDPSLGDDSTWHDVGDKRARKKASQALREKDRSEDLMASLGHGPGHARIPGMASVAAAASAPQNVATAPQATSANVAAAAAAAAAAVAAANDESRKRARQPDNGAVMQERRVAARQEVPMIDPLLAARLLQQLLERPQAAAPTPTPPPPPASASVDPLLISALQLQLQQQQQQQQQQQAQQQQQQQQTASALAAALQSLTGGSSQGAPNQHAQNQLSSNPLQTQNLDRLLAVRIVESLLSNGGNQNGQQPRN